MFREMRRRRQQLTHEECLAILERGTSGVLAVSGEDGYPYAVPLSYVYRDGRLFFHCAKSGHKLFGRARILQDTEEIHSSITWLAEKYYPTAALEFQEAAIQRESAALCMVELQIDHMTGKEAKELRKRP